MQRTPALVGGSAARVAREEVQKIAPLAPLYQIERVKLPTD
jgi:hypothetical protein